MKDDLWILMYIYFNHWMTIENTFWGDSFVWKYNETESQ